MAQVHITSANVTLEALSGGAYVVKGNIENNAYGTKLFAGKDAEKNKADATEFALAHVQAQFQSVK